MALQCIYGWIMDIAPSKPEYEGTLAARLGMTVHVSPLRHRLLSLMYRYGTGSISLQDWLVDIANARGAWVVSRALPSCAEVPSLGDLSNEELVAGLCLPGLPEQLQTLRLSAQLISRGLVDMDRLLTLATRERIGPVLGSLAKEALKVDSAHAGWTRLSSVFGDAAPHAVLLHWSRLAFPVPDRRGVASGEWRLVA
jgi:hypothetical protein